MLVKKKYCIGLFLLGLLIFKQGFAEDLADSFKKADAYEAGFNQSINYEKARKIYLELAKQNHIASIMRLGHHYMEGRGVFSDSAKALLFFRKAEKLGDKTVREYIAILEKNHQQQKENNDSISKIKNFLPEEIVIKNKKFFIKKQDNFDNSLLSKIALQDEEGNQILLDWLKINKVYKQQNAYKYVFEFTFKPRIYVLTKNHDVNYIINLGMHNFSVVWDDKLKIITEIKASFSDININKTSDLTATDIDKLVLNLSISDDVFAKESVSPLVEIVDLAIRAADYDIKISGISNLGFLKKEAITSAGIKVSVRGFNNILNFIDAKLLEKIAPFRKNIEVYRDDKGRVLEIFNIISSADNGLEINGIAVK